MDQRSVWTVSATIALGLAFLNIAFGSTANADDIRLVSAVALHPAIDALMPDFEKYFGHKVTVDYGTSGGVADRVQKGEAADIVISSVPTIDRLQAQGRVVVGSRTIIAKVGVGAFVRKGATKPDISSVDAFKRSMLADSTSTLVRAMNWSWRPSRRHSRILTFGKSIRQTWRTFSRTT